MSDQIFKRVEKKYVLSPETYKQFKKFLDYYMLEDEYGLSTIRNIYYDTEDNELIRTSIDKPLYKEKFRVRCYGKPTDNSKVFLEIKKKYDGVVYKRRISVPYLEASAYLNRGVKLEGYGQIFKEIDYFFNRYNIYPKRYIAYDRLAMYGKEDNQFRVTFDSNIRSRTSNLTLKDDECNEYLLKDGYKLMEVKVNGAMPLWFVKLLDTFEVYPVSFSKYGGFYKHQVEQDMFLREILAA